MQHSAFDPWDWQEQFVYSQARATTGDRRTVYVAGQASVDDAGRPVHVGDMAAQLSRAFDNLETVLRAAGLGLDDVVRLNYYTTDVDSLFASWGVVAERLGSTAPPPTATLLGVARLAYPELLVELEATAVH
jgi:enamine deaminase RidA (YjgF/YER057c/UK114 family)